MGWSQESRHPTAPFAVGLLNEGDPFRVQGNPSPEGSHIISDIPSGSMCAIQSSKSISSSNR